MTNRTLTIDLDDVDGDGIAEAQTPSGAEALSLDGSLGTSLDYARQLSITSTDNDSGITFTVVGTDGNGKAVSEVITGPNNTTVESSSYFKTITSVTSSGAGTGSITVGTVDEASSVVVGLDYLNPNAVNINVQVTGTIDFTVQETFDDIQVADLQSLSWNNIAALTTKTATTTASASATAKAIRILVNSHSSGAALTVNLIRARTPA